jgi:hypothetical protein
MDRPEAKNGFLRCAEGHRVELLKSRPLWQIGLNSFLIAFGFLAVLIHLLQTVWVTNYSHLLVWLVLAVSAVWAIYLAIRGSRLASLLAPLSTVGRQYIAVALGKLLAVMILVVTAAMQLSY